MASGDRVGDATKQRCSGVAAWRALVPADACSRELRPRLGAAADADDDRARIAAALGDGFHVLPRLSLPADVAASFAASTALQGGDAMASVTWLQRAAHVREGASRLEQTLLCAEAARQSRALSLHVGQLPHIADDRWAALPGPAMAVVCRSSRRRRRRQLRRPRSRGSSLTSGRK